MTDQTTRPDFAGDSKYESNLRDRAARLFRFLAELTELRIKKTRDVTTYESVFWFNDLPREPEVYSHALGPLNEQEPWLRIDKPRKPMLGKPPKQCGGWYDPADIEDFSREPQLLSEPTELPGGDGAVDVSPQVKEVWDAYIQDQWRPWKLAMERWDRVQRCYRQLFAIHQEQERRGEQYELLVGVGTLLWIDPTARQVWRPILTAAASLSLHPQTGRIELTAPEHGTEIKLEQDMLEPSERPPKDRQTLVEAHASALESLWDPAEVIPVLKEWFGSLPIAADGNFMEALDFPHRASDVPQMAFAPVLILRKRQGRGILTALKQAEDSLRNGAEIPRGIREICGEHRQKDDLERRLPEGIASPQVEPLFPLPANEEQKKILERLGDRTGVLVQGPPGTGKSHTIVNLVCNFLAQGKRVLVTSQTPRALRVLQDKFPKEVLPLVVSVLDEKQDSRRSLERSVHGILHSVDDPDRDAAKLEKRISEASHRRVLLRAELAQLRRHQRENREADTRRHAIPGTQYSGSPQQIAMVLERDASRFDWFEDDVAETATCPLTAAELSELLELRGRLGSQVDAFLASDFVDPASLPSPDDFAKAVTQFEEAKASGVPSLWCA